MTSATDFKNDHYGSDRSDGSDGSKVGARIQNHLNTESPSESTPLLKKDIQGLHSDLKDLSQAVKETVPLHDDVNVPVLTFRVILLATIFIVPGAFIDTVNAFRTTAAAYSIFFVQIACHEAGNWMAAKLPKRRVEVALFGRTLVSFDLNPGPWSIKETALVTIAAKSGATGNLATNAFALVEIFFDYRVPAFAALAFMWAIVYIGYSYAAIAKNAVSYDPKFQWPQTLMQTALLQSQARGSGEVANKTAPFGGTGGSEVKGSRDGKSLDDYEFQRESLDYEFQRESLDYEFQRESLDYEFQRRSLDDYEFQKKSLDDYESQDGEILYDFESQDGKNTNYDFQSQQGRSPSYEVESQKSSKSLNDFESQGFRKSPINFKSQDGKSLYDSDFQDGKSSANSKSQDGKSPNDIESRGSKKSATNSKSQDGKSLNDFDSQDGSQSYEVESQKPRKTPSNFESQDGKTPTNSKSQDGKTPNYDFESQKSRKTPTNSQDENSLNDLDSQDGSLNDQNGKTPSNSISDGQSYEVESQNPTKTPSNSQFQSSTTQNNKPSVNSQQMSMFFKCAFLLCLWQMLPEFLFPMLSSVAILCYMAPLNPTVNFIGSGLGGMGLLNFSFDWANITSQVMLYPYWVQVIQFIGFVLGAWVLIPLAKWSSLFSYKHGLMSNKLFTDSGAVYPTEKLITAQGTFNETAYDIYGPVHLGPQRAWNMFFDYAAYISGLVWVVAFAWEKMHQVWKDGAKDYNDRLNKLHRAYDPVPYAWYLALFVVSMMMLALTHNMGSLFMPWWTCLIALVVGSVIITPLMWLYALSNFQLPIGTFNELLYGYLIQDTSMKHPAGAAFFGSVAGDAWYRAQFHLESMKFGFYNHIPPRLVFLAQIYGELIGVPINYLSFRWVMASKWDFLSGQKSDPLNQWTGQTVQTYHTNAIQYVILGPRRLFEKYPALPYGFLLGLVCPLAVFSLHRRFPHSKLNFELWNTTVLFSTLSHFYGNISTGYMSKFIGGTVSQFWALRYRHRLWAKYNYVVAAALDTGYNLAMTIIFVMVSMGVVVPYWYGNNEASIERCFALGR